MRILEVEENGCVKDVISKNLEIFFKLDRLGVKSINVAIDYLSIYETYLKYDWIKSVKERKEVVADKCKVSVSLVERALFMMKQNL